MRASASIASASLSLRWENIGLRRRSARRDADELPEVTAALKRTAPPGQRRGQVKLHAITGQEGRQIEPTVFRHRMSLPPTKKEPRRGRRGFLATVFSEGYPLRLHFNKR